MKRAIAVVVGSLLLAGCVYRDDRGAEARIARAMAEVDVPSGAPRRLVYEQTGDGGVWSHEIVVSAESYAERRTAADGTRYAFGVDDRGAWLAVQDRPVVVVKGPWSWQARTAASLAEIGFARPGDGDHRETIGRYPTGWEVAFRPESGNGLTLRLDGAAALPFAVDTLDPWARVARCSGLDWRRSDDGVVLEQARCGSSNGGDRDHARSHLVLRRLRDVERLEGPMPSWARPHDRIEPPAFRRSKPLPITDERRIEVPVRLGDGPVRDLVLDTGAFHTTITEELARSSGVVRTGEPPLFANAPYIGKGDAWVGVADRMVVGGVVLHGPRVLVSDRLGNVDGLLGRDFFRHVILDVDSPRRRVVMWDPEHFRPSERMERLRLRRGRARVEVRDVVAGEMLLDTGMAPNLVVHHWRMSFKHPRHRGEDAFLSMQDQLRSPEYHTEIKGLTLGSFGLPRMRAVGRDREREDLGDGIGILGMGVMRHFRLAFDMRSGWLHVAPGPSYHLIDRFGLEVDDGPLGPTIARVVRWSPAEEADLREGDVLLAMDGRPFEDVLDLRAQLASHRGPFARLLLSRRGHLRPRSLPVGAYRRAR